MGHRDCPDCDGAGEVTWDHGNDPSARMFVCDTCDGTGEDDSDVDYPFLTPPAPTHTWVWEAAPVEDDAP